MASVAGILAIVQKIAQSGKLIRRERICKSRQVQVPAVESR